MGNQTRVTSEVLLSWSRLRSAWVQERRSARGLGEERRGALLLLGFLQQRLGLLDGKG